MPNISGLKQDERAKERVREASYSTGRSLAGVCVHELSGADECEEHTLRGVQPLGFPRPHWKKKDGLGPPITYTNTNDS